MYLNISYDFISQHRQMKLLSKVTLILGISCLAAILFAVFVAGVYIFAYPANPSKLWMNFHTAEQQKVILLREALGSKKIYGTGENIECWEWFNARCGIVTVFQSNRTIDELRANWPSDQAKIEYEFSNDWYSLYLILGQYTQGRLVVNGQKYNDTNRDYSLVGRGMNWSAVDTDSRKYAIDAFQIPQEKLQIQAGDEQISGTIVRIILYIRGR